MSERFRPVSQEVLSDGWGTLTRHTFDYVRGDGTVERQVREVYDRGDAVACLLHDPAGDTLLLTRQFRLPMQVAGLDPFLIEVPAGLLEGAEPVERMRAELMEETGYEAVALHHVADLAMSPGSVTESLACYLGRYTRTERAGTGGGAAEEGEDIEVLHVPAAEAVEMIARGEIRDAKTVALILAFTLRRAG
ncbi:NUDIX domain-containing protein [uncultured Jannaschia sp.]|uniref:NUDIX domain-containing protein n=1 Tax=uncultured Jannaschia sp. TaxID=293347 RepID=UPI0026289CD8|nr:NUDIX domain-containing protein [uncultured Jannaschia sp.]